MKLLAHVRLYNIIRIKGNLLSFFMQFNLTWRYINTSLSWWVPATLNDTTVGFDWHYYTLSTALDLLPRRDLTTDAKSSDALFIYASSRDDSTCLEMSRVFWNCYVFGWLWGNNLVYLFIYDLCNTKKDKKDLCITGFENYFNVLTSFWSSRDCYRKFWS